MRSLALVAVIALAPPADALGGCCNPWSDLRDALAGTNGIPLLDGSGSLAAETEVTLSLVNALEDSTAFLVAGATDISASFKGGVLVPAPDIVLAGLPTGPAGTLALASTWPAGVPSGTAIAFQHWVLDGAGPKGFAASNAVEGTTP